MGIKVCGGGGGGGGGGHAPAPLSSAYEVHAFEILFFSSKNYLSSSCC